MKYLYMTLLAILMSGSYLCKAQVPELMYFQFNSATGNAVTNNAQPATKVSTSGTLTGLAIGSGGQFGNALLGNGGVSSSYNFHSGWSMSLSGAWTLAVWFSGVDNTLANNYLFGDPGSTFRAFTGSGLIAGAGNIMLRGPGMTNAVINGCFNATGSPVVLHFVYDPTIPSIKGYMNGVLATTVTQPNNLSFTGTGFQIGSYGTNNSFPSAGKLDEFRLYNRALSATEIASTWNVDLSIPPCAAPASVSITNPLPGSVTLNWAIVPTSLGYEYIVNQTPGNPAGAGIPTTNTSVNISGLTGGTGYYAHVRNICSPTSKSTWVNYPFTTPACNPPANVLLSNATDSSVDIMWSQTPNAGSYEYVADFSDQPPTNTSGFSATTGITAFLHPLIPNSKYYFHIRSRCFTADSSAWRLDSFVTKMACYAPLVQVNNLGSNSPDAYWDPIPTAIAYEYTLTHTPDVPAYGAEIHSTSVSLTLPTDGQDYYLHVRAKCNSMFTFSPWATIVLRDNTTGIANASHNGFNIDVHPNPVNDKVVVKINGLRGESARLVLTDLSGRKIIEREAHSDKVDINTNGLAPGVYLLKYSDISHCRVIRINKL